MKNNFVDHGSPTVNSLKKTCPKCGEISVIETVSAESCRLPSCGYVIADYWPSAITMEDQPTIEKFEFKLTASITVSAECTVVASSLDEAIELSKNLEVFTVAEHEGVDEQAWVINEIDGSPMNIKRSE